jgi:hypothetical protein
MKEEWASIGDFVPDNTKYIADIGSGLGGVHEFTTTHVTGLQKIFLIDKPESRQIYYGYRSIASSYNQLELSCAYLDWVGVESDMLSAIDVTKDPLPEGPFDVVLAMLSWGYHFPVSTYLDFVTERISATGVLLMDVRRETDGLEKLARKFTIRPIYEDERRVRVICSQAARSS